MATISIALEPPDQPDVLALIRALDDFHAGLYPADSNHFLDVESMKGPAVSFVVARLDGAAVGCGALLRDPRGFGEIKRMYLTPDARGQGIGRKILDRLIALAEEAGLAPLRLETGIHNLEALSLYRSLGFAERGPFGDYAPDPNSVFLERRG
ncbi:GNAT family N-acetyltransferase [Oleomonas cavernae]|uniref:GNAT family N-acetyltransferase n=1 Tax=Oleomonas cavernae TaxID=2320859 RepID=A0A418WDD2_9PROT|nr:GNAT family N-acetyltransferase [Oleomonas cavernae]RJF88045.1 GNAT family N-acetyltransferase [Oleomonas cavernae]